ncbi:MAG: hypothetical protein WCO37_04490 [Bacteroidota bacterium]|jgi:hypothetical protein
MSKKTKFRKAILLLFGFFLAVIVLQYFFSLKFHFPDVRPFSGHNFYNPYQKIKPNQWKKANFHVHTREWGGLTNGMKTSVKLVDSLYTYLGYDIYSISNYQKINRDLNKNIAYIPAYEHGYLPTKNHHIVLNASEVSWLDYLLPQTIDNKQEIINQLHKDTSALIAIAHPLFMESFKPEDFKFLNNYDFIEVLNQFRFSIAHWDSALSTGHATFILADDDGHDLNNIYEIGRCLTFINAPLQKDSILYALKSGCAYGADVYMSNNETNEQKKKVIQQIPYFQKILIERDTLFIRLSEKAKSFKFIGQHGRIKKIENDKIESSYALKNNDTYIRTEITLMDKTVLYLNPVFRYDGKSLPKYEVKINWQKTWFYRISFLFLITILILARNKIKKNKKSNVQ